MTSRLRAILGGSNRVKKKTKPPLKKASQPKDNGRKSREVAISSAAAAGSAAWSDSLPRTKPGVASTSSSSTLKEITTATTTTINNAYDNTSNNSLTGALLTDLSLRDIPQAMRFAIRTMFTPLPDPPSSAGLHSTRVAELLNFRRNLPSLVTLAHLHGLLEKSSPTAVEREAASVIHGGAVRKVVILRRGTGTLSGGSSSSSNTARSSSSATGRGKTPKERAEIAAAAGAVGGGVVELLIESAELYTLVLASSHLDDATKERFVEWLKGNPTKLTLSPREAGLAPQQVDELVRGGFLTTYHDLVFDELGHVAAAGMFARAGGPAMYPGGGGGGGGSDGGINIGAIARAPTGSMEAVGGKGAVLRSGGGGGGGGGSLGGSKGTHHNNSELSIAVPGQGTFLKLRTAALVHLLGLLGSAGASSLSTTTRGELTETMLRERWDGGTLNTHKRARREWDGGVLPGRTRKWKEFWGLGFAWVLSEARGAGLVEVFETGSVGRGVRMLV